MKIPYIPGPPPPELWQLQIILDFIDEAPMSDIDWLLSNYGNQEMIVFWTSSHSRANELIERLEEDSRNVVL
jgi:hypothetical protein